MLNLLSELVNTIKNILIFVTHAISSLITLFTKIPTYVSFITTSVNVLPSYIIPFCVACVSIYVLLFTLGRQG